MSIFDIGNTRTNFHPNKKKKNIKRRVVLRKRRELLYIILNASISDTNGFKINIPEFSNLSNIFKFVTEI